MQYSDNLNKIITFFVFIEDQIRFYFRVSIILSSVIKVLSHFRVN